MHSSKLKKKNSGKNKYEARLQKSGFIDKRSSPRTAHPPLRGFPHYSERPRRKPTNRSTPNPNRSTSTSPKALPRSCGSIPRFPVVKDLVKIPVLSIFRLLSEHTGSFPLFPSTGTPFHLPITSKWQSPLFKFSFLEKEESYDYGPMWLPSL